MSDLRGLTSQISSPSFGKDVKLGVPCLTAACTVGLNQLYVTKKPDKLTQNKLLKNILSPLQSLEDVIEMSTHIFSTSSLIVEILIPIGTIDRIKILTSSAKIDR